MTDQVFQTVVEKYERLVFTICYQFTKDAHIAEDLAQETFLSAYTHFESCTSENIKPWLTRIAVNKAKDYLKSAYMRRVTVSDDTEDSQNASSGALVSLSQPEDIYIDKEQVDVIKDRILALKEPYHKVSVLYFLKERTIEEIASELDRPVKTVHTQLYRAKNMLKQQLKEAL